MPNLFLLQKPEHLKLQEVEVFRKIFSNLSLNTGALHHCIKEGLPFVSADSAFFFRDEFDGAKALSDKLIEDILLDQDVRHKSEIEEVVSVSHC